MKDATNQNSIRRDPPYEGQFEATLFEEDIQISTGFCSQPAADGISDFRPHDSRSFLIKPLKKYTLLAVGAAPSQVQLIEIRLCQEVPHLHYHFRLTNS
jgi:hypothetical protein